jgi:hypothetical protein
MGLFAGDWPRYNEVATLDDTAEARCESFSPPNTERGVP